MSGAWFVYARTPGRVMGTPANAKGWAALFACLALIIAVALPSARAASEVHPALGIAVLLLIIAMGVAGIVALVLAKGRRIG